ncbi:MAG TPA: hypothetical protein VHW66_13840 [Stellaceae bacterium]|jgi:hypothetical protein|nr:hypothetical protein [Stellaceae bacterium]
MDKSVDGGVPEVTPLARAIAELKAEARAAGLTDAEIDAELAAFKAERREGDHPLPPKA